MLDRYQIIAKYHLRYWDTQLLRHVIDGSGLRNRKLPCTDLEALLSMRHGGAIFGVGRWVRLVDGTVERHAVFF